MKVVALIGAVGGAGTTTVAAHLSTALSLHQRQTLCFDWCAENHLRFHFGMPLQDEAGWANSLLKGEVWHGAAFRSCQGIDFIPFGQLAGDRQLDRLTDWLKENPAWLREQLALLRIPEETIVVCDCPRMPAVLRDQVLAACDLVLVVCAPDSVSFATATHIANKNGVLQAPPTMILLNGFDASRQLDRDISALLRTQNRFTFSPVVVHRDESLREAVACKQTVFEFAPSSQAAYDFSALATWVLARLGHEQEPPA